MKIPGFKDLAFALLKNFIINRTPGQEGISTGGTYSGIHVTEEKALTLSVFWACVRILSETLASFPCSLMRNTEEGKEKAKDEKLYSLVHESPNPEMPAFPFFETLMSHTVTQGNGYALIDYDDSLEPSALWIIRPDRIMPYREPQTKKLVYRYLPMDGSGTINLPEYRVLHIPGLGYDGLVGYSVVQMARQAIGLGLAMEEFGSRYFGQGTNIGAVAKHPGKLSKEGHDKLKKDLAEKVEGLGKSHTLLLLEEGLTFEKTTIAPNDSQFLESRKFEISDIARWFLVQPHRVGDLDRATFSNIEQQSLEFIMYTMLPWTIRWEQWLNFKLLPPRLRNDHYFKFEMKGLLRGDTESRFRGYAIGRNWGWYSANDIRELEDMNRLPGEEGNIYMAPANMLPADQFENSLPNPTNTPTGTPANIPQNQK